MKLLSGSKEQTKMSKSAKSGLYLPFIMHLAPVKLSGYQVCARATSGCAAACLNTAGLGIFNNVQQSRIMRTKLFFEDRNAFVQLLTKELARGKRKAEKEGKQMTVRLNGTSDLIWESYKAFDGKTVFEMFPDIIFYDYTKIAKRSPKPFENYHLTFSVADGNEKDASIAMENGMNLAIVFRGKELPKEYYGRKVIDGDKDDLRFLDPKNVVVGLLAKGKAKQDRTGFVKDP